MRCDTAQSLPATWLVLGGTLALTIVLSIAFGTSVNLGPRSAVNILDYGVTAVTWTQCGFFLLGVIASYTLWSASVPDTAPPAIDSWSVLRARTLAFLIPSISVANGRDA